MVVNWSNWGESKPGSRLTGWPKPSLARNWSTCGCAGGKALFIFKSHNFISLQLNLCVLEFIFNPTVYTSGHTFNNHYLLFSDHIQQYRSCILIICCAYLLLALLLYLVYHGQTSRRLHYQAATGNIMHEERSLRCEIAMLHSPFWWHMRHGI